MNINQLVLESSKNINPWKTTGIIQKIRREKIHEVKKQLNVNFDLENDEPCGDKRDIRICTGTYPSGEPRTNVFKCQLMKSGGDWEYPVAYFFCQLIKGSLNRFGPKQKFIGEYSGERSFFCFIPINGNCLVKDIDKYNAYTDEKFKKEEVPEIDDNECWNQLKTYLEKISNIKSLDKYKDNSN